MFNSSPPTVVLCVKQGTWGDRPQESAERYFMICVVAPLQEARRKDPFTQEEFPAAKVEVVDTLAQAKERLARGGVDVVVLDSRSMIDTARELKKQYPRVTVFVLTGLIPQDEVVLVYKGWVRPQMVASVFLHTPQGL